MWARCSVLHKSAFNFVDVSVHLQGSPYSFVHAVNYPCACEQEVQQELSAAVLRVRALEKERAATSKEVESRKYIPHAAARVPCTTNHEPQRPRC